MLWQRGYISFSHLNDVFNCHFHENGSYVIFMNITLFDWLTGLWVPLSYSLSKFHPIPCNTKQYTKLRRFKFFRKFCLILLKNKICSKKKNQQHENINICECTEKECRIILYWIFTIVSWIICFVCWILTDHGLLKRSK